jgi:hypothetical protein
VKLTVTVKLTKSKIVDSCYHLDNIINFCCGPLSGFCWTPKIQHHTYTDYILNFAIIKWFFFFSFALTSAPSS